MTTPAPSIMIAPALLTAPAVPKTLAVFVFPAPVFQLRTSVSVAWPTQTVTFRAGGRTGPATVSWCPGYPPPTMSFVLPCTAPKKGSPKGLLRYTKTKNQFGGPASSTLGGKATVAHVAAFSPGCPGVFGCAAAFSFQYGVSPWAIGNKWGVVGMSSPAPLVPGVFPVNATAMGKITHVYTSLGVGTGPTNAATSFAGPWTTGRVTVSVTNAAGIMEVFVRTGSDMRVSGVGGLTLIAGAVSTRTLSGPNANRGWIRLYVPEPSAAIGAAAALLALVACHGLVRRRSR